MMKLIFQNIFMYILSLVLFNGPLLFYDFFSPLYLMWIAPIFLICVNIFFAVKQKSSVSIWRIIPSSAVIIIGYIIDNYFTNWYYLKTTGDIPDPFTYLITDYFYIGSFILVAASICIYQCAVLIGYIYSKHKEA